MLKGVLVPAALLLAACAPPPSEEALARERFLERRAALESELRACDRSSRLPYAALVAQARCLVLEVPENPALPQGRRLPLKVMRIPAFRTAPLADPLVILVGGPGQAATEAGLLVALLLGDVRQQRDILLVDQRGTGALSPFDCEFGEDESLFEDSLPYILERQGAMLRECLEGLEADPAWYTTDMAVADLERVREHFGYAAFNLWGGSYGTRVALAYLQAHPAVIRSAVLDGVAPTAIRLPLNLAVDASASMEKVLALCEEQPSCRQAFPDIAGRFRELLASLESPVEVELRDPASGQVREVAIGRALFTPLLRSALYSREYIRLLPLMIDQALRGEFRMLAAMTAVESGINQGMFLSVICNEDLALARDEDIEAALGEAALLASNLLVQPIVEACALWPARELDPRYFEPVASSTPVLILSGALDPVTPPRWGELAAEGLPNSRHLVAEGVAHIVTPHGCAPRLITAFIAAPDPAGVDAACLDDLGPRPFFLNLGGSASADD